MRRRIRRRLEALDVKRGMGDAFWSKQKKESERRMAIIDDAPPEWRELVNQFDPDDVAEIAGQGHGIDSARWLLRAKHGRPI